MHERAAVEPGAKPAEEPVQSVVVKGMDVCLRLMATAMRNRDPAGGSNPELPVGKLLHDSVAAPRKMQVAAEGHGRPQLQFLMSSA
mmetsp:Transcript_76390/g.151098  ORF Transcript_76390/g.151098 Transcript_76390/m.151098 type:complete len:86 (-) Transcript_76390:968-1225(-)